MKVLFNVTGNDGYTCGNTRVNTTLWILDQKLLKCDRKALELVRGFLLHTNPPFTASEAIESHEELQG